MFRKAEPSLVKQPFKIVKFKIIGMLIMTDQEGNMKIWLEGFRRGRKQLTITQSEAGGNSQLFPDPTESREVDRFSYWPRDQSLFSYCHT